MKHWMHVLMAFVLVACIVAVSSTVATPTAKASAENIWVNCQTHFTDGPKEGSTDPVSFLISSGGTMTAYSSDYTSPGSGTWSINATTTDYTFSAHLSVIPGVPDALLTVNHSFTTSNDAPMVSTGTGTVVDGNGNILFVTHTQTTCPYFFPNSSNCLITYQMTQWTGNFTTVTEITNTGTSTINSGGTLVFVFPGTQTVINGWDGSYSQSGNVVTISNLAGIVASGSISPGFNGAWSGSNPDPLQYALNGLPCAVAEN